jgi:hypothetical protein
MDFYAWVKIHSILEVTVYNAYILECIFEFFSFLVMLGYENNLGRFQFG